MKKTLGYMVIGVAAFLLGWGVGPRIAAPTPVVAPTQQEQPARTAAVMLDFGDGTVKTYDALPFTEGESLFDITKRAATEHGLGFENDPPNQYGILITQIGDKRGGPPENKYWTWYENGRMGQVSADTYKLVPGDVLEWKFVNLKME